MIHFINNYCIKFLLIIILIIINEIRNIFYIKKNKIIAISYSNERYLTQLKYNQKSALEIGKVDEYYAYYPKDIDEKFKEINKDILIQKRGNGYWLWKPYILLKTMKEKMNEGDFLIYTDACILYKQNVNILINFLNKNKQEMLLYRLSNLEKKWTKRDAFILMGADSPYFTDTYQYQASYQIYRKSKLTLYFLEELLYYSQDKRIITDDNNTLEFNNYEGFKENRHDQSVLSVLTKKYGLSFSGKANLNMNQLITKKYVFPTIFCHYRRMSFKNYKDLLKKCGLIK